MTSKYKLLYHQGNRPYHAQEVLKKDLALFIQNSVKRGHYPTRRELESRFHFRFCPSFGGIAGLYGAAGLKYTQKNDQEIKNRKAQLFTQIVLDLLSKFNLEPLEVARPCDRGVDILAYDTDRNLVGVELKAFNKFECIKKRNIDQLIRFKKLGLNRIILITTTSRINPNLKMPSYVEIKKFEDIQKIVSPNHRFALEFIRNKSVHIDNDNKKRNRKLILNYVKKKTSFEGSISDDISRNLHLDIYSYFTDVDDLLLEVADATSLSILIRHSKLGKRSSNVNQKLRKCAISKILKYMRAEISNGKFPSQHDVECALSIRNLLNFVSMKELYRQLKQPHYYERKARLNSI